MKNENMSNLEPPPSSTCVEVLSTYLSPSLCTSQLSCDFLIPASITFHNSAFFSCDSCYTIDLVSVFLTKKTFVNVYTFAENKNRHPNFSKKID